MAVTSATKELIPHSWKPCFEARGIDAHITNAGLQFDTTAMMLERIDRDVPNGTVALVATLVAVSVSGCVGIGKGKGKAPLPVVTKG
jgi:hypothetical protein